MAEPHCPECKIEGMSHIISKESDTRSNSGTPWFEVVYCDACGHVYNAIIKHVLSHNVPFSSGPSGLR